jgi:hypothetical protein
MASSNLPLHHNTNIKTLCPSGVYIYRKPGKTSFFELFFSKFHIPLKPGKKPVKPVKPPHKLILMTAI